MEVQQTGGDSFYIYLNRAELPLPASSDLTAEDALALVRRTVGKDFAESGPRYCLELYEGRDALLLFARPRAGKPAYFIFRGVEDLISAARSCRPGIVSFLFVYENTYYLTLFQKGSEKPPARLYEFGEELALSELFPLFLSEHGAVLSGPYAIDEIRDAF